VKSNVTARERGYRRYRFGGCLARLAGRRRWHAIWLSDPIVEIAAVMIVGALVGRAGRHMLQSTFLEDGMIATLVGVLGAMVTTLLAHGLVGPVTLGASILIAAFGTMAFFSIYVATVDRAAGEPRQH
jgi:uncharacterized membrane protein YeaQ/YmgE (transglycosylase-associated protein family)